MGRYEDTQEAYYGEKEIVERDKMGLVQALTILHRLRDASVDEGIREAFNVVFEWVDNAVILFSKIGGNHG